MTWNLAYFLKTGKLQKSWKVEIHNFSQKLDSRRKEISDFLIDAKNIS